MIGITLAGCAVAAEPLAERNSEADEVPSQPPANVQNVTHSEGLTTTATPSEFAKVESPTAALIVESTLTIVPPTVTSTPDYTPTPDIRPEPRAWRTWPVIPQVSQNAIDIYQRGLEMGTNPSVFSIIGDCQSEPPVFLGIYDQDRYYLTPDELYLEETIAHFQGNFDRTHATVKNGLSVASVFSPLWAPEEVCQPGETPLECEFRLRKPSIVFINLGTNWKNGDGYTHEKPLREIIEFAISQGVLPILSTKGDNQEGDHSINLTTAQLAYEYDIPLWNYWSAIQYLPNHGLDDERPNNNYLTVDAWSVRSYTGLRALDRVWRTVNGMEIQK